MSSAQEQIVHSIVEGFKEQKIDAIDWLRHKILGALINADAARDAEIARLREIVSECATACGAFVSPKSSLQMISAGTKADPGVRAMFVTMLKTAMEAT